VKPAWKKMNEGHKTWGLGLIMTAGNTWEKSREALSLCRQGNYLVGYCDWPEPGLPELVLAAGLAVEPA
jgi:hypothetical protein